MVVSNIFIAKRKGERSHVFLRPYRRQRLKNVDYSFTTEELEDLLLARDPESFVRAVSTFYPLSLDPLEDFEEKEKLFLRKMTVKDYLSKYKNSFEVVDEPILLGEYTGLKNDGTDANKSSLKRMIKDYDAIEGDALAHYLENEAFKDDDIIIAESVLDWLALRTFITTIIQFQAFLVEDSDTYELDVNAKQNAYSLFIASPDNKSDIPKKPFAFDTYSIPNEDIMPKRNMERFHKYNAWFLGYLDATPAGKTGVKLKNSKYFKFQHGWTFAGKLLPFSTKARKQILDRSLYLVIEPGHDPYDLIYDFINAVLQTTYERQSGQNNAHLGWEYNFGSGANQIASPKITFYSQAAEIIYKATFRDPSLQATICRNCGRAILNHPSNKLRKFCCPSCRNIYSEAHKEDSK